MEPAKQRALTEVLLGLVPADGTPRVLSYRHPVKCKKNPQVGLENETTDSDACINCRNEFPLFVVGAGRIQSNSGMCRQ